ALPVVGSLPVLPERVRRGGARPGNRRDQYWRNLLTESVDSTRTMLLHAASRDGAQIIMVASALGGEGKTTLASHLVASLARAGRRVLLVDGDLRRPALHKVFNLPAHPGLAELLRGEVDLNAAIQAGPIPGLSVLTAGQPDAMAVQALSHGRLAPLFQQ